jgi:hypothetical protein
MATENPLSPASASVIAAATGQKNEQQNDHEYEHHEAPSPAGLLCPCERDTCQARLPYAFANLVIVLLACKAARLYDNARPEMSHFHGPLHDDTTL